MSRVWLGIIFLTILTVGLSPAVPMEDLPETAFDESEEQPFESTPRFSGALLQALAWTPQPMLESGSPYYFDSLTRGCERRAEHRAGLEPAISGSLIILDHSFRC